MSYFLFLAVALAVAAIGYWLRKRSDFFGKVLMISGCIGCVGLIVWEAREVLSGEAAKPADGYHATASYALGQQVAHEMSGQRGQVVLIYPPARSMDPEVMDASTYVFARVLLAAPGLQVRQTNLPATPAKAGRFSSADFEQVFTTAPMDVAYVSFAGVPPGIEALSLFQRNDSPRLFVFDPLGTTDWLAGLKQGVIRRVIVPRPDANPAKGEQVEGRPDEVFQRYFLMATPKTADQVAAQLIAK